MNSPQNLVAWRDVQRPALDRARRCPLAADAAQHPALADGLPAARHWLAAGCFEAMVHDLRTVARPSTGRPSPAPSFWTGGTPQSTCESGPRAGCVGGKRERSSKMHMAVDTLGLLLAAHVTPINEQERAQAGELARQVQQVTGQSVKVAFADQGYTGEAAAQDGGLKGAGP